MHCKLLIIINDVRVIIINKTTRLKSIYIHLFVIDLTMQDKM